MVVIDEVYNGIVFQLPSEQLIAILQEIKSTKEKEINVFKEKIKKYEQTRRAHEVWYQSLSPLRKLFTGRPPSHHQAVEYIVNVKERFNSIEKIKILISRLERVVSLLQKDPDMEEIILPAFMIEEIRALKEKEDLPG